VDGWLKKLNSWAEALGLDKDWEVSSCGKLELVIMDCQSLENIEIRYHHTCSEKGRFYDGKLDEILPNKKLDDKFLD